MNILLELSLIDPDDALEFANNQLQKLKQEFKFLDDKKLILSAKVGSQIHRIFFELEGKPEMEKDILERIAEEFRNNNFYAKVIVL